MRVWNWVEKLHGVIAEAQAAPFNYRTDHCGLFAARCADAMTDSHHAVELQALMHDEASAKAYVESLGGLAGAITQRLGESVKWWQAQRGDIALVPTQDGPGLGVIMGETIAMLAPVGITYVKLDKALSCWRVS